MNKRSPWHDPNTEKSRLLAALDDVRRNCCNSEEVMPHAKEPGNLMLIEAIKEAVDNYAEHEMGRREYFWGRPHSTGCKHT